MKHSYQKPHNNWKMMTKYLNIDLIQSKNEFLDKKYFEFYKKCYLCRRELDLDTIKNDIMRTYPTHQL